MQETQGDLTQLVQAAEAGDRAALNALFEQIYPELRLMASQQRAQRDGGTLNTTGLVHECFVRLSERGWRVRDRSHFFALAGRVMRQILVDTAREKLATKRGGVCEAIAIDEIDAAERIEASRILEVHELLLKLAAVNLRQAQVVECRFFAGLSEPETAEALGMSARSVSRDWADARDWMRQAAGA